MLEQVTQDRHKCLAILPWGDLIEDYLDTVGLSLEQMCREMTGGWLFGYVEALKRAGVECVLVVVTARLKRARSFRHEPTGMLVRSLPCRPAYRGHRRFIADPYARTGRDMFGVSSPWLGPIAGFARPLVPYLNTPIVRLARELRSQKCDAILCQECEFSRFDCLTSTPMGQVEVIA